MSEAVTLRKPSSRFPAGRLAATKALALAMLAALALAFGLANATGAQPAPAPSPVMAGSPALPPAPAPSQVRARLVPDRAAITPGVPFHVALHLTIAPGWHVYWRNPGDSGTPTSISWRLPDGVSAGPLMWPAPEALPFGPLVNYGYSRQVVLPARMSLPPGAARAGGEARIQARAEWLECSDICVPGGADLTLVVPVRASGPDTTGPDGALVAQTLAALPARWPGAADLVKRTDGRLDLRLTGAPAGMPAAGWRFFPHERGEDGELVVPSAEQTRGAAADGATGLILEAAEVVRWPSAGERVTGVLTVAGDPRAWQVDALWRPDLSAHPLTPVGGRQDGRGDPAAARPHLAWTLLLAFLGGLVLNLMPCVLPVLSIKILSVLDTAGGDRRATRAHGLAYSAGILASMLALGGALVALKAGGAALGWGFQMQSPIFVGLLMLLSFAIGLNLLGLLHWGDGLQALAGRGSAKGAFVTGLLATSMAAPCTAPFMGAALGQAALMAPLEALAVFAAMGAGFALPFLALTLQPAWLDRLPRPGPWMERLKEALAFPMLATAAWLLWVLSAQAGRDGLAAGLAALVLVGLAVWARHRFSGRAGQAAALALSGLALAAILAAAAAGARLSAPGDSPTMAGAGGSTPSVEQAWSVARTEALRREGRVVLVNFTADWCVTCKINEAGALADARVRAALAEGHSAILTADWTRRDDAIAAELARHGRAGVPLYLVWPPGAGGQPDILPQLLTADGVLAALERARSKAPASARP